jgi:hypothetical protein
MIVQVESCWSGHPDKFHFRLTLANGTRLTVAGATWTRKLASAALDLLESEGYDRKRIRFNVR